MRRCLAAGCLAAVAVLGTGCAGGETAAGPAAPGNSREAGREVPAISAGEAIKVLDETTAAYNKAVRSGDAKDWRDVVTDALTEPFAAQARMYGPQPRTAAIALLNPVFYVPRLPGYPRWFAAAALQRTGRYDEQVLLLFVRRSPSDRWRAAHRLAFKGRPPELDLDAEGYAQPVRSAAVSGMAVAHASYLAGETVPPAVTAPSPGPSGTTGTTDAGVPSAAGLPLNGVLPPGSVPGTATPQPPLGQGTEGTDGTSGPDSTDGTGGADGTGGPDGTSGADGTGTAPVVPPFTPDAFTVRQRAAVSSGTAAPGWTSSDRFSLPGHPSYALRTADGGALVWYDLQQTRTYESTGGTGAAALPAEVQAYLRTIGGVLGTRVTATWTWLAIGYLPAQGKATVLGESLYITQAASAI